MIAQTDPKAQYLSTKSEIDAAIQEALIAGQYILGPMEKKFEADFAAYCGLSYGIGVANGTDALHLALRAVGVSDGDEVITTSHTATATASAIRMTGATPVFIDTDDYFSLDIAHAKKALSSKTKAVVAVHLYGQSVDLRGWSAFCDANDLILVEDCAQAHGAIYGEKKVCTFGRVASFSFYPTKNLGAIGDGGAVVTSDPKVADRVKLLAQYGWRERYVSEIEGYNSRLDELQAAILSVKLKYLDANNQKRNRIANRYYEGLEGLPIDLPKLRAGANHVYHQFVIRCEDRDSLRGFLLERGIHSMVHYPTPIHLQPGYASSCRIPQPLTRTEADAKQILSLPMYPELSDQSVDEVIHAVKAKFS